MTREITSTMRQGLVCVGGSCSMSCRRDDFIDASYEVFERSPRKKVGRVWHYKKTWRLARTHVIQGWRGKLEDGAEFEGETRAKVLADMRAALAKGQPAA